MAKSRFEVRVGLFVLVGLVLLAALTVMFSKGFGFGWDVYQLKLRVPDAGGLKLRADVLMAGVKVGSVAAINLAPDGKDVLIIVKMQKDIHVRSDAEFKIEQSGFLGDQYISITPTVNAGVVLTNLAEVKCEEPFNMLEAARNANGLIVQIENTAQKLDAALNDLHKHVFNEQTLSNFAATIGNIRAISDHALQTVDSFNGIVETNSAAIGASVSNLVYFSKEMSRFSISLNELTATNSADITAAIDNVEASTEALKSMLADLQAGKGLAGVLLKDEQTAANFRDIAANITVTTSNINSRGLWGILWKPKPAKTNAPAKSSYRGRSPFNE